MSDAMDVDAVQHNQAASNSKDDKSGKLSRLQYERQKKKDRKKKKQQSKAASSSVPGPDVEGRVDGDGAGEGEEVEVEIEYIVADPLETLSAETSVDELADLRGVLAKFSDAPVKSEAAAVGAQSQSAVADAANEAQSAQAESKEKVGKKRRKALKRLPVAVLKQLVRRPDLVEIHDTCAANPFVLLHLKAYANAVPVPRHWSQRRRYLQGKRGVEKAAFDLPDFIKKTGIMEIRGAAQDKDAASRLKSKTRERTQGSGMGKIDIDYRTLHDAFFRYQTKPKLTAYGDLYYEGKEYEVEMHEKRPGALSVELREALGMPDGAPPPWLMAMQRIGPPPSYPNLRVPGVNAPLPAGAELGMHVGGWGRPLTDLTAHATEDAPPPIDLVHWGELPVETAPVEEEEADEGDEDEGEESAGEGEAEGEASAMDVERGGLETPLGGLETPQHVEGSLRKRALYEVLHEAPAAVGSALMASERTYAVKGGAERVDLLKSQRTEAVDIALAPEEIGKLTEEQLKKRYERAVADRERQQQPQGTKRKERDDSDDEDGHKSKKKKEFKF